MQQRALPYLTTERLVLRQLQLTDDEAIFRLRSNKQVNQFIQRPLPTNIDDARNFITSINEGINQNGWLYWAIVLKTNPHLIGTICLWHFSHDGTRAEIGYELHPDYQGVGLMQEAMQAIINYGFTTLQITRFEAYTQPDNNRSLKLLGKNHFVFDSENNGSDASGEIKLILDKPFD